jgi:small-conductance mechanosensitive channel
MSLLAPHLRVLAAAAVLALSVLAGFLVRRFLLTRLSGLAGHTERTSDDHLLGSLRRPLPVWGSLAGIYLALRIAEPPPQLMAWSAKALLATFIASVTLWAADLGGRLLAPRAAARDARSAPVAGVVRRTVQALVVLTGGLVLLGSLGISIAPLLTTLGIGGLAVALGLQDTLANLFAGIHLTLAGNIRSATSCAWSRARRATSRTSAGAPPACAPCPTPWC